MVSGRLRILLSDKSIASKCLKEPRPSGNTVSWFDARERVLRCVKFVNRPAGRVLRSFLSRVKTSNFFICETSEGKAPRQQNQRNTFILKYSQLSFLCLVRSDAGLWEIYEHFKAFSLCSCSLMSVFLGVITAYKISSLVRNLHTTPKGVSANFQWVAKSQHLKLDSRNLEGIKEKSRSRNLAFWNLNLWVSQLSQVKVTSEWTVLKQQRIILKNGSMS